MFFVLSTDHRFHLLNEVDYNQLFCLNFFSLTKHFKILTLDLFLVLHSKPYEHSKVNSRKDVQSALPGTYTIPSETCTGCERTKSQDVQPMSRIRRVKNGPTQDSCLQIENSSSQKKLIENMETNKIPKHFYNLRSSCFFQQKIFLHHVFSSITSLHRLKSKLFTREIYSMPLSCRKLDFCQEFTSMYTYCIPSILNRLKTRATLRLFVRFVISIKTLFNIYLTHTTF